MKMQDLKLQDKNRKRMNRDYITCSFCSSKHATV